MKFIDLGLSVLWADCNIGANTPEEFGNYYSWNDIPKEYKIPTKEQQDELRNNCTWTWVTQNGVNGYKVTSKKNGNSIFLPAAGYRYNSDFYNAGSYGYYWSNSINTSGNDIHYAYYLFFCSGYVDQHYGSRVWRFPIRPIKSKTNFKNKTTMTLKEVNEIFPLKSGMCLELFKGNIKKNLILFQHGNGEMCYTEYNDSSNWGYLNFTCKNSVYDKIKVYQSPTCSLIFDEEDLIFNSDDYKIKELTLQEIADKFGIKVEHLRIKE